MQFQLRPFRPCDGQWVLLYSPNEEMSLLYYHLQKARPDIFPFLVWPAQQVPIRYRDQVLCTSVVDNSGIIAMDLPDNLKCKINTGEAFISPFFNKLPVRHDSNDGRVLQQLTAVEILELE